MKVLNSKANNFNKKCQSPHMLKFSRMQQNFDQNLIMSMYAKTFIVSSLPKNYVLL